MAIEDNTVLDFPNLMGNFVQFLLDLIAIFLNSWIMILMFFAIFTTFVLFYRLFITRFIKQQ
jgi:hypothetical protein